MLTVENLSISFKTDEGIIEPIRDVSFSLKKGETLGIVGESGSGKSVSTRALMRLLPKNAILNPETRIHYTTKSGEIVDIISLKEGSRAIRNLRGGEMGMIFQEPMASFSPVYTIGNQMIETVLLHRDVKRNEARQIAIEMLEKVGLSNPHKRIEQFPDELSGGMRQRAMIAMALSAEPALLIADEPTTALDVTIQAQVLELMDDLRKELGMSMIFITHDLAVVSHVADYISVMYLGVIVESGTTEDIIKSAKHPYTQALLEAIPSIKELTDRLMAIPGDIPGPLQRPAGCPFHTRCLKAIKGKCDVEEPPSFSFGSVHQSRCWLNEDEANA